ncbi:MAG TPA: biotin transporter BioY [Burkholderiaceae bacterium]|nr:biotin transporter BioY [Burkholderiaceae bacterium]
MTPQSSSMASHRDLVRISLFAAMIAVFGLVPRLDLPFLAGVPITLQTLGVMLAGLFLKPKQAAYAVLLFLFVVCLGAPFLSGGRGGLGVLFGPSAGFLFGWVIGAWLVSVIIGLLLGRQPPPQVSSSNPPGPSAQMSHPHLAKKAFVACLIGGVPGIYCIGIPWLAWRADMTLEAAAMVSLAFLPGDLLKAGFAAWLARQLSREILMERRPLPADPTPEGLLPP